MYQFDKPAKWDPHSGVSVHKEFIVDDYISTNSDLAQHFADCDKADIFRHFEEFGCIERRGIRLSDYIFVDSVLCSDKGDFFITGWADRRIFKSIELSVQVGYVRYGFPDAEPCWYDRPDVNAVLGDHDQPSGFAVLLRADEADNFLIHSAVVVAINGVPLYQQTVARWLSSERFLLDAMGACAILADRPIGETLESGQRLHRQFLPVWNRVVDGLKFSKILAVNGDRKVRSSIIITIYRRADMLLMQLSELAEFLERAAVEVVVVLNDVANASVLVEEVMAFCQIHPIAISVYNCSGNSGFSAGNNFGASVARGNVLVFMNPDIFPPLDNIEGALGFLVSDPGEGLHGTMLYYGDGLLMHSGMYVVQDLVLHPAGTTGDALRVEHFGKGLTLDINADRQALHHAVAGIPPQHCIPSAALWKIRKKLFFKLGGLSTDYIYAYYEDAAFGLDALRNDVPVVIDTSGRWIHLEGVGKSMPPHARTFMWLNRAHFSQKYAGIPQVVDTLMDQSLL
ncbi:MAG TPA: glycosyltransferase [Sphingobium sp.]|nr:glycosyltransferase [Sphingobium sp.]